MKNIRLGIFAGTIILNKNHFDVRQLYITERLRHLVTFNDSDITVICSEGISPDLKNLECNFLFFRMSNRRHFKVISSLFPVFIRLLRLDCDILQVYSSELTLPVVIAQLFRRKKFMIVYDPMGLAMEELKIAMRSSFKAKLLRPLILWQDNWLIKNSSAIVVYTESMKQYYSETYNVPLDSIFVAPYGYDHRKFSVDEGAVTNLKIKMGLENKKVVAYTGRLSELHGSINLLRAMKILEKLSSNVVLIIAGSGPQEADVAKFIEKENLRNVILEHFIPFEDVPHILKMADVLVIPHAKSIKTDVDAPTKLFEYLAAGKPIVSFDLKAIREVVGENAILVEPDNPRALAQGILKACSHPSIAEDASKNGAKIVKKYTWKRSAMELYKAYEKISA